MKLVLKPYFSKPTYGNDLTSARLRIEVIESEGISSAIFLYERYTILRTEGLVQEARFIAVAKPGDLTVYPYGAPANGQQPSYFRLSCVDLAFNSPSILEETYSDIVEEATQLIQAMRNLEDLEEQDEIIIEG